jgi:hypothetical protein
MLEKTTDLGRVFCYRPIHRRLHEIMNIRICEMGEREINSYFNFKSRNVDNASYYTVLLEQILQTCDPQRTPCSFHLSS